MEEERITVTKKKWIEMQGTIELLKREITRMQESLKLLSEENADGYNRIENKITRLKERIELLIEENADRLDLCNRIENKITRLKERIELLIEENADRLDLCNRIEKILKLCAFGAMFCFIAVVCAYANGFFNFHQKRS